MDLDFVLMVQKPLLHRIATMDGMSVYNPDQLALSFGDQAFEKQNKHLCR